MVLGPALVAALTWSPPSGRLRGVPPSFLVSLLFRRRHIWVPTALGSALLLLAFAGVGLGCALAAYGFLAPNQPAIAKDGRGARILVVEGWLAKGELDKAVFAFRQGDYERVVATAGRSNLGRTIPFGAATRIELQTTCARMGSRASPSWRWRRPRLLKTVPFSAP